MTLQLIPKSYWLTPRSHFDLRERGSLAESLIGFTKESVGYLVPGTYAMFLAVMRTALTPER